MEKTRFNTSEVYNIVFDGIDYTDLMDFSDAYIVSADYNGIAMTEYELKELNDIDTAKDEQE